MDMDGQGGAVVLGGDLSLALSEARAAIAGYYAAQGLDGRPGAGSDAELEGRLLGEASEK